MNIQDYWTLRKIVLPQHTDHAGVMWHGAYISWLEESRVEALSNCGIKYNELSEKGYEMAVVNIEIQYLSPLYHGDEVLVKSHCLPFEGLKLPWKTLFLNKDLKCAAKAKVELVLVEKGSQGFKLVRKVPTSIDYVMGKLIKGPSFLKK